MLGREPNTPRKRYEKPKLTIMTETELLASFQMTAAKISAASCWWGSCACAPAS